MKIITTKCLPENADRITAELIFNGQTLIRRTRTFYFFPELRAKLRTGDYYHTADTPSEDIVTAVKEGEGIEFNDLDWDKAKIRVASEAAMNERSIIESAERRLSNFSQGRTVSAYDPCSSELIREMPLHPVAIQLARLEESSKPFWERMFSSKGFF